MSEQPTTTPDGARRNLATALVFGLLVGAGAGWLLHAPPPPVPALAPPPADAGAEAEPPAPAVDLATATADFLADLAGVYQRHGRKAEAADLYADAIAKTEAPDRKAELLARRAALLVALGRADEGEVAFATASDLLPDGNALARLQYRAARAWQAAEEPERAKTALHRALRALDAADAGFVRQVLRTLVEIYRDEGALDTVVQGYVDRLKKNPADPIALDVLETVYWDLRHDGAKAAPVFLQKAALAEDRTTRAELLHRAGRARLAAGAVEEAIAPLAEAVATAPDAAAKSRYGLALAEARLASDDTAGAREALLQVIETSPNRAEQEFATRRLFEVYRREGKLDAVIAEYQARLAETPDDVGALERLSEITWNIERRPDVALVATERLAALKPRDPAVLDRLAAIQEQRNDLDAAVATLTRLVALTPKPQEARVERLARLLLRTGRAEDARAWARKLVAIEPGRNNPFSHLRAGALLVDAGAVDEGVALIEQAPAFARTPAEREQVQLRTAIALRRANLPDRYRAMLQSLADDAADARVASEAKRLLIEADAAAGRDAP